MGSVCRSRNWPIPGSGDLYMSALDTPQGLSRVRTVEHLAGGQPRIWSILADSLSIDVQYRPLTRYWQPVPEGSLHRSAIGQFFAPYLDHAFLRSVALCWSGQEETAARLRPDSAQVALYSLFLQYSRGFNMALIDLNFFLSVSGGAGLPSAKGSCTCGGYGRLRNVTTRGGRNWRGATEWRTAVKGSGLNLNITFCAKYQAKLSSPSGRPSVFRSEVQKIAPDEKMAFDTRYKAVRVGDCQKNVPSKFAESSTFTNTNRSEGRYVPASMQGRGGGLGLVRPRFCVGFLRSRRRSYVRVRRGMSTVRR